jgi:ferredoxin
MAYVVCEPCRDCKYTDCVTVCPTDAFYQDERMLYIHPDECICCGACVPECPVGAIHAEGDVPEVWRQYVQLNAERAAALASVPGAHITEPRPR